MLYQQVQRSVWRRHPVAIGAAVLIVSLGLWNGWYDAVAVGAIACLLIVVSRRRRYLALRDAGLRARADYEHRLSLIGDPRGTFGRYPPVQPGWFPDPQNRCQMRYFDGAMWTGYTVWR